MVKDGDDDDDNDGSVGRVFLFKLVPSAQRMTTIALSAESRTAVYHG